MASPFVTIVIPVLNDAAELGALLPGLPADQAVEIIVVSGGHLDPALAPLARRFPHVVWRAAPIGRGVQMNRGAEGARGRWLLFLHADVRLSPGWLEELRRLDGQADVVGGSFRFTIASSSAQARLIERGVAWRVRLCNLPYGDQALFVRREAFRRLGGFHRWRLMEDVDLVRRLARHGRLWHSPLPALISPRRWEREGWARRSVKNLMLLALYSLGVSPDRLARRYYGPLTDAGQAAAAEEREYAAR